jgi:hypothetical protein
VGYTAGDIADPTCHDVRAYDAAGNAREDPRQEGMLEEGVPRKVG